MAELHDAEHLGSQFALELDGIELARFTGCSGLAVEVQVVEYQDVSSGTPIIRKRPGRAKYTDIELKRGLSADKAITDWLQKVLDGAVERANGSIVVYDSTDKEVDRWNFERGWPSKWSASDLSADSDDVMIESLTISHEFLTRA